VLSDNDPLAEQIILCLKKRLVRVTITGLEVGSRLRSPFYCDRFVKINPIGNSCWSDTLLNSIEQTCERYWIDVIVPAGTGATIALAGIASRIKGARTIPLPDCDTFNKLNDKMEFAAFMSSQGLPHPRTWPTPSVAELEQCPLVPPVIVKPATGEGNQGIELALDSAKFEDLKSRLRNRFSRPLIVQEYIPGSDIDLSLVAIDGNVTAWTIQERIAEEEVRFLSNEKVLELGTEIIKRTRYNGVAHIDMRVNECNGSITVIEFNPRFWFTVAASEAAGVNFPYIACSLAANKTMPEVTYKEGVAWFMNGWRFKSD